MTLAHDDPRLHVGHDGVRYASRTVSACDVHIRDLTRRIKACEDPILAFQMEQDRDAILEIRLKLAGRKTD